MTSRNFVQRLTTFMCTMAAFIALTAFSGSAIAQLSTVFTYQGRLDSGGVPYNGNVDFQFRLFDSPSVAGGQVAGTLTVPAVSVVDGVFTASLDFGASVFDGDDRWLDIRVRAPSAAGGPYMTLSPRQRLSATPYALYALTAGNSSPFILNGSNAVFTGGNVGVGTLTPTAQFEIDGTATSTLGLKIIHPGSSTGMIEFGSPQGNLGIAAFANNGLRRDIRFTDTGLALSVSTTSSAPNTANGLFVHESANVGIGNTAPAQKLHVSGAARFGDGSTYAEFSGNPGEGLLRYNDTFGPKFIFRNSTGGSAAVIGRIIFEDPSQVAAIGYSRQLGSPAGLSFSGASNVHMKIVDSGHVGIGTVSPSVRLHVEGGNDTAPAGGGFLVLGSVTGANLSFDNNEIMARSNGSISTLHLNADGGIVSIGQNAGSGSLLQTRVLQITGGADLAESFDVIADDDQAIEPGMVVCIDPSNPGKLIPSTRAYDCTVAGVISGAGGVNSGMIMGQEGSLAEGAHPVALTGRVYVMVDASIAAITPGDLLTTSDVPGHAMKAADRERRDGAVIGKAMTGLPRGERGLVLVLISLQ